MFIIFSKYKTNYREVLNKRGQLAPFFIAILALIIIAIFVTVNIGKISLSKTYSANAADAGSLAGASVMANNFNALSQSNSYLVYEYRYFYAAASFAVGFAIGSLWPPIWECCSCHCKKICGCCHPSVKTYIRTVGSLMVSFIAFHLAQFFHYLNIRKTADKARDNALELAYRFAFINSGISSNLSESQRDKFNEWLDTNKITEGIYEWEDGQKRKHRYKVAVNIDEVKEYKLKIALSSFPDELLSLYTALDIGYGIQSLMTICPCSCPAVQSLGGWATAILLAFLVGLLPLLTFTSSNGFDSLIAVIAWIDDVVHNRLVRVDTFEEQEGFDYGLWKAEYPQVHSYSIASFQGNGKIYPPVPKHDSTIVETD